MSVDMPSAAGPWSRFKALTTEPTDTSGADTMSRYSFQHHCVAREALRLLNRELEAITCEWHVDFSIVSGDGVELISVKTREPSLGPWTLASLASKGDLSGLLQIWRLTGQSAHTCFLTNAKLSRKPRDAAALQHAIERCDIAELEYFADRLAVRLDAPPAEMANFLSGFRLGTGLPHRAKIEIDTRRLCNEALARRPQRSARVTSGEFYERLMMLVLKRSSATSPVFDPRPFRAESAQERGRLLRRRPLRDRAITRGAVVALLRPRPVEPDRRSALPAEPLCLGREAQLADIVQALGGGNRVRRAACVLGAPGVGKSTVAVAAAHQLALRRRYGPRRILVRCDGLTDSTAMWNAVSLALGLSGGPSAEVAVLDELARAPALLLFDNGETPWLADQVATERIWDAVAGQPGSALLISVRGEQVPGLAFRTVQHLPPLSEPNAREMFLQLVGRRFEGDPDLDLLEELDGLPLAVSLLAAQTSGLRTLAALRERWRRAGVSLLRGPGRETRDTSLSQALELSLQGELLNASAQQTFGLLGRLPEGLAVEKSSTVLGSQRVEGLWALHNAGLLFLEGERMRMLGPIREFARSRCTPGNALVRRARQFYGALAAEHGPRVGYLGGRQATFALLAEGANTVVVLDEALRQNPTRERCEAVLSLTNFIRYSGFGDSTLLQSVRNAAAKRLDDPELEGRAVLQIARVHLARQDPDAAEAAFEEAQRLLVEVDSRWKAEAVKGLGDVHWLRGEYELAVSRWREALPLFEGADWSAGVGYCHFRMAEVANARGRAREALTCLRRARRCFEAVDELLGLAGCDKEEGDVRLRQERYEEAQQLFDRALPRFEEVGDVLGQANCLFRSAQVILRGGGRPVDAHRLIERAEPMYLSIGNRIGQANCAEERGRLAEARGWVRQATLLYTQAEERWSKLEGRNKDADRCRNAGAVLAARRRKTTNVIARNRSRQPHDGA